MGLIAAASFWGGHAFSPSRAKSNSPRSLLISATVRGIRATLDSGSHASVPRGTILISQLSSRRGIVDRPSNEDKSALRFWYADCRLPCPSRCACDPHRVLGADPEQEMTSAGKRISGPAKELFELANCPASDEVRKDRLGANFLKSLWAHFDIGKLEGSYNLG